MLSVQVVISTKNPAKAGQFAKKIVVNVSSGPNGHKYKPWDVVQTFHRLDTNFEIFRRPKLNSRNGIENDTHLHIRDGDSHYQCRGVPANCPNLLELTFLFTSNVVP